MLDYISDVSQRIVLLTATKTLSDAHVAELKLLLTSGADWDFIRTYTVNQGTAPLFYRHIKMHGLEAHIPEKVFEALSGSYFQTHTRTLAAQHTLVKVLAAFNAEGIDTVILKGMAMSEFVYGDTGLRPMGDTDLWVHPTRLLDAERILFSLGFKNNTPYKSKKLRTLNIHNHLNAFTGPHIVIELHNALSSAHHIFRLPDEEVWQNKIPCTLGGQAAFVLSHTDNLQYLSVHAIQHLMRRNVRLNSFVDIAELLKQGSSIIAWDAFILSSKSRNIALPVLRALDVCSFFLKAPVAESILKDDMLQQHVRLEFAYLIKNTPEKIEYTTPSSYLKKIKAIKGCRNKMRYMWAELFPSQAYMIHLYKPKSKRFLFLLYFRQFFAQSAKTISNIFQLITR